MAPNTKPRARTRRGTPGPAPASTDTVETALRAELQTTRDNLGLLAARLEAATAGKHPFAVTAEAAADLERALTADPGWRKFTALAVHEFSAAGLRHLRDVCRLMSIANPLIKRGLNLRSVYVWGQGCEVVARANGKDTTGAGQQEQDVQAVLKAHIDDPGNQRALWGAQARDELEHAAGTDGEVYVALFTNPRTGWVQARTILADEITDVITDPDDASTPWYYRRVWTRHYHDAQGRPQTETQELLYPDVDYKPATRPRTFGERQTPVRWDAPVVAIQFNRPRGWQRGIPDTYAAVNWARAYKEFLEQWAGLMKSLSRFAWRLTAEGRDARRQARAALTAAAAGNTAGNPSERDDVGGFALTDRALEAIPKSGATIDAGSGRPLAMMVAAGLDVPVTMLLADPGQTGARATAETLDWPTELSMMARRSLWTAFQRRIAQHVITESVRAPQGALKGTVKRDPATGREVLTLDGDTDTTVDVNWPDLDEVDAKEAIDAITTAARTGTIPPELVLRLLLQALNVREVDGIIAGLTDEHGNFKWPQAAPGAGGMGQQAADLARAGGDPAAVGPGPMGPDGQPTPAPVPGVGGDAAARQADADFGLFGGRGADAQATDGPDEAAQTEPGAVPSGLFDPAFFALDGTGTANTDDTADTDDADEGAGGEETDDVTDPDDTTTTEATARQADVDFGLGGGSGRTDTDVDDVPDDAGDQPTGLFDPDFYRL